MPVLPFLKTPRAIVRTGDDSAASTLFGYVRRMSGWHQVVVCVIAVGTALLNLVPIELQRRITNEAVETQDVSVLLWLGSVYVAVILAHQAVKFGLNLYQTWLTESAVIYTRSHLFGLYAQTPEDEHEDGESGRAVSILGAEVDKLAGFVGEALSAACANSAMLIGVCAYMFVVEPQIAIFALAFLIPQVIVTPLLQRYLNELVEERVGLLRDMSDEISNVEPPTDETDLPVLPKIYRNHMRFFFVKFVMKALLNLLSAAGPATVLIFGGYLVLQGETQVGVLVAFLSGFERMSSPVRELIAFYRVAAQANVQHRMIAKWMQ